MMTPLIFVKFAPRLEMAMRLKIPTNFGESSRNELQKTHFVESPFAYLDLATRIMISSAIWGNLLTSGVVSWEEYEFQI